ncbi:hypothetical protein [Terriglobus aquaticus]|uniref:Integral membrane protein n=1 Tax=Terriglobus aquaticus TaxID=940139 RepID=A0ABW9KQ59_9BACT|nr:hypothetical protein [Terriglobus aquaticus]
MYVPICYFSYLLISIALTVWVARTLHSSGRVFLVDAFHGNEALADSVNSLLVVGFYMMNLGYVALYLKTGDPLQNLRAVIELESAKLGAVMLVLGIVHFLNILVLTRMRNRQGMTAYAGSVVPSIAAGPATAFAAADQVRA